MGWTSCASSYTPFARVSQLPYWDSQTLQQTVNYIDRYNIIYNLQEPDKVQALESEYGWPMAMSIRHPMAIKFKP